MKNKDYPHIFIPSYHRPHNVKTAYYFINAGYTAEKIHVVIDNEAEDKEEYEADAKNNGYKLHIFDIDEARARFDYVHRASKSRRSAGQARNMFYDIAKELEIDEYVVIDDDTNHYEYRPFRTYIRKAKVSEVVYVFTRILEVMRKHHIGCFGLSQTGDMFGVGNDTKLMRMKVMNTTFINTKYIYRGERGVQDDDTSQFVGIYNEGLFTGSLRNGIILHQTLSATQQGGLTDLYNECKLLNKALVCVIQFPSAIQATRQVKNGGRLHHKINNRYLLPKIIRGTAKKQGNIEWDRYPEDYPFTNEPINRRK